MTDQKTGTEQTTGKKILRILARGLRIFLFIAYLCFAWRPAVAWFGLAMARHDNINDLPAIAKQYLDEQEPLKLVKWISYRPRGDHALIVQLFSNLVENAILHTPPGTAITLALAAAGGHARVTVGDDGPGVPRAERRKLFRRFYRGEASRTRPGHGLGLSLVAAVAELHGAALTLRDDPRPGLWFDLDFPLETAP